MARELGRAHTRGIGSRLLGVGLAAAVAASLCACSGPLAGLPHIRNPFAKKEEILPGERIAVITDPGVNDLNQGGPPKPVSLPPPQTNASWTEPGGTASNNLGHLALADQVQKVWSADAGTGSSSSGRLSAMPLVADGKSLHARCRRHGLGVLLGERRARVERQRHAGEREAERGVRRRLGARRRPSLCYDRLRHCRRHRSEQRRYRLDQDRRRAGAKLAHRIAAARCSSFRPTTRCMH